jgi:hypothetical protein
MIINPLLGKFELVLLRLLRCFEIPTRDSFNLKEFVPLSKIHPFTSKVPTISAPPREKRNRIGLLADGAELI